MEKFRLKIKVLYQVDYKDYIKYQDAIFRWQEKGYFVMDECLSSKEEECYTVLANDGYNR